MRIATCNGNNIKSVFYICFAIIIRLLHPAKLTISIDVFECVAGITLLLLLFYCLRKRISPPRKYNYLEYIGFALFSLFSTLSYLYGRDLSLHDMNIYMGVYLCISLIVNFLLAQYGYQLIEQLFQTNTETTQKTGRLYRSIQKNKFSFYFIWLFVVYLIFLAINYPGTMMFDSVVQILQINQIPNITSEQVNLIDPNQLITTHHPVLHTMLIKLFLSIGDAIGNLDFGIFLYSLFQITVMAAANAYLLQYVRKYFSERAMLAWLLIFSFNPIILMYSYLMTKDTIFAVLFALFGIKFYEYIKDATVLHNKKWAISFLVITVLCSFFRNNFFYAAIISFIILLLVRRDKALLKTVAIYLCLYFAYTSILIPALGITNGSIREVISVPFQQTANYAKYYGLTAEEEETIGKILDIETLKKYQDPEVSNLVKNTYNKHATSEELADYFKTWAKMFFKHPDAYFDAYFNQFYGYFSTRPYFASSYCMQPNTVSRTQLIDSGLELSETLPFMGVKNVYDYGLILSNLFPVLYLITNSGLYIWILLAAIIQLIKKRKKHLIWFYLPFILYFLTLLLSPANASIEYRYMFPYLIAMPILLVPARKVNMEISQENAR